MEKQPSVHQLLSHGSVALPLSSRASRGILQFRDIPGNVFRRSEAESCPERSRMGICSSAALPGNIFDQSTDAGWCESVPRLRRSGMLGNRCPSSDRAGPDVCGRPYGLKAQTASSKNISRKNLLNCRSSASLGMTKGRATLPLRAVAE